MVYIDRNGRVLERRPWDLARVQEIFRWLWFVVVYFFKTLCAPFMSENNGNRANSNSRRSGWGGGGPGGGPGTGRGNGPQQRRIGRIVNTSMDCNIPGGG